jgi:hypothetical protein
MIQYGVRSGSLLHVAYSLVSADGGHRAARRLPPLRWKDHRSKGRKPPPAPGGPPLGGPAEEGAKMPPELSNLQAGAGHVPIHST